MHQKLRLNELPLTTRLARTQDQIDLIAFGAQRDGKAIEVLPADTPEQILEAASEHAKMAQQLNEIDRLNGLEPSIDPVKWADNAARIQQAGGHVVRVINQA